MDKEDVVSLLVYFLETEALTNTLFLEVDFKVLD
jgi:hypothetical protein